MKEEINLLPPHVQKARRERVYRKRVAYLGRRALAALVLLWVALAGTAWWIGREEQAVKQEIARHTQGTTSAEAEVRLINE
ncbi:MAG: hypothetical protein AAB538_01650, partial [Patescibacteria group bacterium]